MRNDALNLHFVIPAKAGIYLLPCKFSTGPLRKPTTQMMDLRLRGGDETLVATPIVVEDFAAKCQNNKMTKKLGYNALIHFVCVQMGFCGSINDQGELMHVDFYIPDSGSVTAEQFVDWVFLADGMDPNEDLAKWHPLKKKIKVAFVTFMGSESVDARMLQRSFD